MTPTESELDVAYAQTPAVYALSADYDPDTRAISITLNTMIIVLVPVRLVPDLETASTAALSEIVVSPSGLGLHWPQIDIDLYLPSLLNGVIGRRSGASNAGATSAAA